MNALKTSFILIHEELEGVPPISGKVSKYTI